MLHKIIHFSIAHKWVIMLFTAFLIAFGAYEMTRLPIDAVPDITDNQVQVITVSPALGAPDVERFITFPIEQVNGSIPGLKEIRSFSRFGLSVVTIVFHDNVDVYWARQQVSERLIQAKDMIPEGLGTPGLAPVTTGLGEIYQYVVRPKPGYEQKYTPVELRTIQDWIVRRQLLGVPGVADVSTFGGMLKQYEVKIKPELLQSYGLTIGDVFNALAANNENTGGSYIEKGPTVLFIRTEGLAANLLDIEQMVIKMSPSGVPVKVKDVAEVGFGTATRYGAVCYNDQGETAGAVVMMLKGENSSAVIKRVKARIDEIKKTLPEGVEIEPFLDRTKMVDNAIGTVETNLMEGALIVVFVLVMFLGNFRAGLVVASVIPLSMLFAVILMNMFGVSGNLMSLGALDFGLIVDGAVIIVEAVMHRLAHHLPPGHVPGARLSQSQLDNHVEKSASKMMSAAVFGQIIILIVYLPIFSLEGIEGKMFKPMAQTVSFALLGAFILSMTYVPAISSLALSKDTRRQQAFSDKVMHKIENWYKKILELTLDFPKIIIGVTLSFFVLSLFVMSRLGGEFIPELEEGDFAVDTRVLTGSNLQTTIDATQKSAKILLERFPEVEKVVTKIGSGEIPTDPMPIEASDMMVILKDKEEWTSARSFDELAEKMSSALQEVPGVTAGFQYPVQMRFNELMTGAKQDVVCKIFGENLDTLAGLAARLGEISGKIDGATEIFVETVTGMPQIVIRHNRQALAQYGLDVVTVNRTVNAAFAGAVAGQVFEDEKRFDLIVRLENRRRADINDVQNLPVTTASGIQVPLRLLAQVEVIDGPNQIQRDDARRRIIVGFNVRGRDVQSVVNDLSRKVESEMKFPAGYFIHYGGSFENLQAAKERLSIAVPVSLLLIFLMLNFAFGSVRQGLLIYSAIPLSAVGGIMALWMRGMPFSISAGIGFIALFGVAVLNGIVLLTEFNKLSHDLRDLRLIVVRGATARLRPVLMTAAVASLGFLPMAFSTGAGAEVQRPLATVVIGGLITATLLTLFMLPILYRMFAKINPPGKQTAVITGIAVLLGMGLQMQAQQPVWTLHQAVDSALMHHPALKTADMKIERDKALENTAFDRPMTEIDLETGQLNTAYWDSRIDITQPFYSPQKRTASYKALQSQTVLSQKESALRRKQIEFEVQFAFSEAQYWAEKITLMTTVDSLMQQAATKTAVRAQAGESGQMEKYAAELQKQQAHRQLKEARSAYQASLIRLVRLTGANQPFTPAPDETFFDRANMRIDSIWNQAFEARVMLAKQQIALTRAGQLPEYRLGLSFQSIKGPQTIRDEERIYGSAPQFMILRAGVSLPTFKKAAKARVQAAEVDRLIAQQEWNVWQYERQTLRLEAETAWRHAAEAVEKYQLSALPAAQSLHQIADRRLALGEIDYLEWLIWVKQAYEAQADFIDLRYRRRQASIQLAQYH